MAALGSKRWALSWTVTPGFVFVQTFSVHMIQLVGTLYKVVSMFEEFRLIPLLHYPDKRRSSFYSMHVDRLLSFDTSAQQITLKRSRIAHSDAG